MNNDYITTTPPKVFEELDAARNVAFERLKELRAAEATFRDVERDMKAAKRTDAVAYAESIRSNRKDPGEKNAQAVAKKLRDAERRVEALRIAVAKDQADIAKLVLSKREEWQQESWDELKSAQHDYQEAVSDVALQRDRMSRATSVLAWLVKFPEEPFRAASLPFHASSLGIDLGSALNALSADAAEDHLKGFFRIEKPGEDVEKVKG